jgi:hypothetical protein
VDADGSGEIDFDEFEAIFDRTRHGGVPAVSVLLRAVAAAPGGAGADASSRRALLRARLLLQQDVLGRSALFAASQAGHAQCVEALLRAGLGTEPQPQPELPDDELPDASPQGSLVPESDPSDPAAAARRQQQRETRAAACAACAGAQPQVLQLQPHTGAGPVMALADGLAACVDTLLAHARFVQELRRYARAVARVASRARRAAAAVREAAHARAVASLDSMVHTAPSAPEGGAAGGGGRGRRPRRRRRPRRSGGSGGRRGRRRRTRTFLRPSAATAATPTRTPAAAAASRPPSGCCSAPAPTPAPRTRRAAPPPP